LIRSAQPLVVGVAMSGWGGGGGELYGMVVVGVLCYVPCAVHGCSERGLCHDSDVNGRVQLSSVAQDGEGSVLQQSKALTCILKPHLSQRLHLI